MINYKISYKATLNKSYTLEDKYLITVQRLGMLRTCPFTCST